MQVVNPIHSLKTDKGTGVGFEMMTSMALVKNCMDNIVPTVPSVICDYFGIFNTDKLRMDIIFGVYREMVLHEKVSAVSLHNALIFNRLNIFIHKIMAKSESQYYKDFKTLGIRVGTNTDEDKIL